MRSLTQRCDLQVIEERDLFDSFYDKVAMTKRNSFHKFLFSWDFDTADQI